jgi:hypothetical protein
MTRLVKVDFDPFSQNQPKLVPVEGNPFEQSGSTLPNSELAASHSPDLMASHGKIPQGTKEILSGTSSPQPYETTGQAVDRTLKGSIKTLAPVTRPVLEGAGLIAGGTAGAAAGVAGGPIGMLAGGAVGAGAGYATGKGLQDTLDIYSGEKKPYKGIKESSIQTAKDFGEGAKTYVEGELAGPVLGAAARTAGKVVKPILGRMSGVGTGAVEEALRAGSSFDKALRGKIKGDEIVDNARSALTSLKDQRAAAYQGSLAKISQSGKQINTSGLMQDLSSLMKRYNVKVDPSGKLDTSRIAMGKTGRNDVAEIIDTVSSWGSKPGDTTAEGLDVLKRQLDDFYSDSSQARQFVSSIRNSVKNTISKAVPEYEKMTKGYSEATKLIKDIESGLMMRKQGISGRIVADQTLRRLMSSMKDNYALRKELVDVLGKEGGQDLSGQIAGFTMRSVVPVGLAGTGPALAAEAAYSMVNPSFWPVLAASSPRVQGEFLRVIGKTMQTMGKISPQVYKETFKQILINRKRNNSNSGRLGDIGE